MLMICCLSVVFFVILNTISWIQSISDSNSKKYRNFKICMFFSETYVFGLKFHIWIISSAEFDACWHALLYQYSRNEYNIRCNQLVDYIRKINRKWFSHPKASFLTISPGKDLENYHNHKADSLHAIFYTFQTISEN